VEDSTGSQCFVEKELWDYDNRVVILHVKAPFVSSSEDTVLNLFYDETMVDHDTHVGEIGSRPAQNVWDLYFTHVLHLSESGNGSDHEYKDSTARGNHGTGVITPNRVAAQIGYGQSFGSKSDGEYIQVDGPDPDGSTEITLEVVFKPDAGSLSKSRHILQNPGKGQNASFFLRHGKYFESWMYISGATKAVGTTPLVGGKWYYGAGRWRSGEPVSAWLNDTREAASAEKSGTIGRGIRDRYEIGNWHTKSGTEFENGATDEIRISSIKRSDAWLKATYYSLFNTLVDYEFGPDSDADGILDNDEIDIYGTDPYNADSDADGINDGDELAYWGEDWDADADDDGLINLLDPDSDNDGLLDGEEIDQGFDPADPGHFPLPSPGYRDVDYGLDYDEQQGGGGIISETVRLVNGNLLEYRSDVSFSSPHRMGLSFHVYYNSRSGTLGDMGYGWTHSYEAYLDTRFRISGQTYLKIVDETRRAHLFRLKSPGVYTGAFTEKSYVKTEGSSFVWYRLDGSRYGFSIRGRLIWIDDGVGNRLAVKYDAQGFLDSVQDNASGRMLRFHYLDGLIDYIEGPATDAVSDGKWVEYEYDAHRNLTSVTYADGSGFDYIYNDPYQVNNLTGKKDKQGHRLNTYAYDRFDRCIDSSNSHGQGVGIRYETGNQVDVTDDYGVLRTYMIAEINGRRRVTAMLGAPSPPYSTSYAVNWTYDEDLNLTEVEYANSTVNQYQNYDSKGNPETSILASGETEQRTITWTYHPDINMPLTRTEPSVLGDGDKVTIWDYDDDHDAAPNENPTGLITRIVQQGYTKNTSGQTVSYENVTTFVYNEYGQILTIDGPRTDISDVTSFEYDSTTGNLNTITHALIGDTTLPQSDYNAAGLAGKIIDVNGQSTRFTYDGKGRIIAIAYDADGSTQKVTYNDAGLPDYEIDEDGIEKSYEYDDTYGRLLRRYDPENNYIQYLYDDQGNLVEKSKHVENGDRYSRHRWNYQSPDIKGKLWKTEIKDRS
jgi:YD repeat-containing protein